MNFNKIILLFFACLSFNSMFAQLEKVIVEKYYVSDDQDSTDTFGGILKSGSTTYRIYVDLKQGSKLTKMYADANHKVEFASTEVFFNHLADGQSYAKDFIKNRYMESTIALDTWLTLGQTAKKQSNKTHYGILKNQDVDGSFIGGINNDGGSQLIASGLLINNDPSIGFPLTTADGMDTMNFTPDSWLDNGVKDFFSGNDSTIFGSLVPSKIFSSNNFYLQNSGVTGVIPDSNQILVAQLTTFGELSFEFNIEILALIDGVPTIMKYVADDSILASDEVYSPFLKYPFDCGCNDANYLEYDASFACLAPGSCITPVVLGCMDSMSCNYDPNANVSVPELCCYPGSCGDRDIAVVCPSLMGNNFDFEIAPNPTNDFITLNVTSGIENKISYIVYNAFGVIVTQKETNSENLLVNEKINMTNANAGLYLIKVVVGNQFQTKLLMKN